MFDGFYKGKRVFVTGHTGFKGSWLCEYLRVLGAKVSGFSLSPNTTPSLFELLKVKEHCESHNIGDIQDFEHLQRVLQEQKPDIVIHMAAQPLVRESYHRPLYTWNTNVIGVANLLESIRSVKSVQSCVIVTTDKCYENKEWYWGYRETDPMGGHDPYSASKGAAELLTTSYRKSFFSDVQACRVSSARAGNVIGGGDWSKDRIVVDFVESVSRDRPVSLRNPKATRPWQHVLEPLTGYLALARANYERSDHEYADAYNFGPSENSIVSVKELALKLTKSWGKGTVEVLDGVDELHEASVLKLDCSKAHAKLNWKGIWDIDKTVKMTVDWYKNFYENGMDLRRSTSLQIEEYICDMDEV
jgi:CDP-glucose 4,6-dehydratase